MSNYELWKFVQIQHAKINAFESLADFDREPARGNKIRIYLLRSYTDLTKYKS